MRNYDNIGQEDEEATLLGTITELLPSPHEEA
jgi:hypothetical protein